MTIKYIGRSQKVLYFCFKGESGLKKGKKWCVHMNKLIQEILFNRTFLFVLKSGFKESHELRTDTKIWSTNKFYWYFLRLMDMILLARIIARIKFYFSQRIFSSSLRKRIESDPSCCLTTSFVLLILYLIDMPSSYIGLWNLFL